MKNQRNNKKWLVKRGCGVATPITLPLDPPLFMKNYEEPKGSMPST